MKTDNHTVSVILQSINHDGRSWWLEWAPSKKPNQELSPEEARQWLQEHGITFALERYFPKKANHHD